MAAELEMNANEEDALPFADCESIDEKTAERQTSVDAPSNNVPKKDKKSTKRYDKPEKLFIDKFLSRCYFENADQDNNRLTMVPYTGPCNTNHLERQVYVPQIESKRTDSTLSSEMEKFFSDYNQTIEATKSLPEEIVARAFIRVGIAYLTRSDSLANETLTIKDFLYYRNRAREIKSAFYTCKGVTSPKRLITTLHKLNYRPIMSNYFTYDIQLYVDRNRSNFVLHFQLDEQFRCRTVSSHPAFPSNFDFIRDKSSSLFRSIDDSYADMFDFRLQLTYTKHLPKDDPLVLKTLQKVSIDEILFFDRTNEVLRIAPKLRRNVKYLKCNRSNQHQNDDEQIRISIGSYEEYTWDQQGICRASMKAENTMTIELLDQNKLNSAQKLYDVGLWFSNLCQSCVDVSLSTALSKNPTKSLRWFSAMAIFARKYNKATKQINVKQLTTYKGAESNRSYTSEDMSWLRKIMREGDLKDLFSNFDGTIPVDRKEVDQRFHSLNKRLELFPKALSGKASKKVMRAYRLVCQEIDD